MLAVMTATRSSATHSSVTSCGVQEGLERTEECGKSGWDGSEVAEQNHPSSGFFSDSPHSPPYTPTLLPASTGKRKRDRKGVGKEEQGNSAKDC